MPNLGDKLKAQIEDRNAKHIKGEHAKTVAARMKFEADQMKARAINEEVKAAVIMAVETNTAYVPVSIKHNSVYNIYRWTHGLDKKVNYNMDPHSNVLDELIQWGVENGLRISLRYDHDGVGIESWFNVVVEPL